MFDRINICNLLLITWENWGQWQDWFSCNVNLLNLKFKHNYYILCLICNSFNIPILYRDIWNENNLLARIPESEKETVCLESHIQEWWHKNYTTYYKQKQISYKDMDDKPQSIQMKIFHNSYMQNRIRLTTFHQWVKSLKKK